jgi:hypothetical protein
LADECAYLCNIDIGADKFQSAACADANRSLYGCRATLPCDVIQEIIVNQISEGDTCHAELGAIAQACD